MTTFNLKGEEMKNVVIYVDYENIHNCFLKEYKNCLREGFFEKLRRWCLDHDLRILDIKVYCNFDSKDLHDSYHQTKLQEYGLETFHTSNKGKNYADLKISTDLFFIYSYFSLSFLGLA